MIAMLSLLENMRILQYNVGEGGNFGMAAEKKSYASMMTGPNDYDAFYGITEGLNYYGMHCHDFYEIYVHYGGGIAMRVNDKTYDLKPDMLMIFPPFCMHGLAAAVNLTHYERGYLSITTETLRELGCGCVDMQAVLNEALKGGSNQFRMEHGDAEQCRLLLSSIDNNTDRNDPVASYENMARIVSLMGIVLRTIGNKEATQVPSGSISIMQDVLTYINDHYTEPMTLQDIADRFHISTSFLSHEFSAYTNRSVYDYILYRRITLAQMMLHSDKTISEIAGLCGFADYSGFLRKFSSLFGMSPKAYRKTLPSHQA